MRMFQKHNPSTDFPKVFNTLPSRMTMVEGTKGNIPCSVHSNPPATLISWLKNNHSHTNIILQSPKNTSSSSASQTAELELREVTWRDAGVYWCVPWSSLGQGQPSKKISVSIIGEFSKIL